LARRRRLASAAAERLTAPMSTATPLAASRLFAAPAFVVRDPPGRAGRWLVRRARGAQIDPRHLIVGADDEPLGLVRRARRRPQELLYMSRWEVVDPGGTLLLALLFTNTSVTVRTGDGRLGVLRRNLGFSKGPPATPVRLLDGDEELGCLAPRAAYGRSRPPGESRILDAAGMPAAQITGAGDYRHVVEISAGIDDALRVLVIAFACSFVNPRWLWWRRPGGH
jgi:hypothetical protein